LGKNNATVFTAFIKILAPIIAEAYRKIRDLKNGATNEHRRQAGHRIRGLEVESGEADPTLSRGGQFSEAFL
jgi:hypothetical protein